MFSHRHVMGDLHKVVDLRTMLDDGLAERRAVDRDIRAEFYVVFNRHTSKLRNLVVPTEMLHVAEPVGSDDGSTMDRDSGSDGAALANHDVGEEHGVVPDRRIGSDEDSGIERDAGSDPGPVSERDEGPNRRVRPDGDVSSARDLVGDASRSRGTHEKFLSHLGKGEERVLDHDLRDGNLRNVTMHEQSAGRDAGIILRGLVGRYEGQRMRGPLVEAGE